MRRITTWLLGTISALVLLFSYHTSTDSGAAASVVAQPGTDTGATSGDTPSTDGGTAGDSGGTSAATTHTGDAVMTRFGNVQVEITVENGRITDSQVTQVPWNDHKDQEINSYAVPILNREAVDAQSADIDMVSGATYTSQGYIQSLQSAIDQANL
ncbi:MAG TPA: FMN-binding protein [Ornithinibacter sp.]|nr:FMN-binding protein [Ornithinibacter sp.]